MSEPDSRCIISMNNTNPDAEIIKTEIDVSDENPSGNDSIKSECQANDVTETSMSETREELSPNKEVKTCVDESVSNQDQQVDPIDLYRKLEIIKEIKNKTVYLQRIKTRISQEVDCIESETKSVADYKTELELLVQEEKAHLEELRQIQNDISMMESTIKQTNEEKIRALESARRLHYEYKPLKEQINHLRDSIGLEKTDDNDDETLIDSFLKKLTPISQEKPKSSHNRDKNKSNAENSHRSKKATAEYLTNKKEKEETNISGIKQSNNSSQNIVEMPVQLATAALMAHSLRSISPNSLSQQQQQHFQQHFNPFILNQVNMNNERYKNLTTNNTNEQIFQQQQQQNQLQHQNNQMQQRHHQQQQQQHLQPLQAPFRQQPPPMKTCMSCNQQIHRNAPICPLCKAKSRSTNPKKPKKKVNDTSPNTIKS